MSKYIIFVDDIGDFIAEGKPYAYEGSLYAPITNKKDARRYTTEKKAMASFESMKKKCANLILSNATIIEIDDEASEQTTAAVPIPSTAKIFKMEHIKSDSRNDNKVAEYNALLHFVEKYEVLYDVVCDTVSTVTLPNGESWCSEHCAFDSPQHECYLKFVGQLVKGES